MADLQYYTLLTEAGNAAYAAAALGKPVEFAFVAVGDGGGQYVQPVESWTGLANEVWRGQPNAVYLSPDTDRIVRVEVHVPHSVGGFVVREIGLLDPEGTLLAVANYPETVKPSSESGAGKELLVDFWVEHTNAEHTTLKIDPAVVMASRKHVEVEIGEHDSSETAHGKLLAGIYPLGSEGQVLVVQGKKLAWANLNDIRYTLGEFYYFRHPTPQPGFQPAQGGLLADAATKYPKIWQYLQSAEGKKLCKTEAEWQAMTRAIWHTNADGSQVGWNGIGGAPFYAPDLATGALRLPDLRGMYAEAAGFDSLGVGAVAGDQMRQLLAGWTTGYADGYLPTVYPVGAATTRWYEASQITPTERQILTQPFDLSLDSARIMPVGPANAPRRYGALACVYLGQPAA